VKAASVHKYACPSLAAGSARLDLVAAVAWSVAFQASMGFHLIMEVQMDTHFAFRCVEMLAVLLEAWWSR
jgi:hypothetical protein